MEQPLITVIIPVYNIPDCLERCVASVCAQTWKNLEILLVDDGSTDGTGALCDSLAQRDGRIRVFHKQNGGSSSARNMGIENAGGEWLGFVDSDDFIEPRMYETMMKEALKGGYRIVQISRDEIGEDGKRRPDVCVPPKEAVFRESGEFFRTLLLHEGDCSFCTKLVDAALFQNRRFPEGELNEDFYLLLQLLPEAGGVRILPQQFYHVYYRMGSNTRKKDRSEFSRVFLDIVKNADFAQKLAKERFPQYEREAARFGLYQRLDFLLHIPVEQMTRANAFYREVIRYCRANVRETVTNPYLTKQQKLYLLLLTAAPRPVRALHRLTMRMRDIG
ncbi:MAG TPA: glycosyltransferase [Candidatus Eisenbergiella intestinipullorum]|nr:glycosyltransferase [Candidatus Eisenbergiella intestinipullorum]